MAATERVPLLDTRIDLTRSLTSDERAEIAAVSLPVVMAEDDGAELYALLAQHDAFGATVLDGLVMNSMRIGEQTGIQLLGPGDLLLPGSDPAPKWISGLEARTAAPARLALFGNELLNAAHRWPRILQSLYTYTGEQLRRITAQLVICQIPRVDDRVHAMLWLLAESWGHVTSSGVRLPLLLTHETLGALVGARRPTVTLALRNLVQRGAIVHQDSGWLLLEPPAPAGSSEAHILPPETAPFVPSSWADGVEQRQEDPFDAYAELRDTVRRLREQHLIDRQHVRDQLTRVRGARLRVIATRKRIGEDAIRRRSLPSS